MAQDLLRRLPSIDALLTSAEGEDLIGQYGREKTLSALRAALDSLRQRILQDESISDISPAAILATAAQRLQSDFTPTLRPVINATGIVIHTNLGRALLSDAAQAAVQTMASQYNTLEFDLDNGVRGSRYLHAEAALTDLTGAEAALVVNNNAAALVLALSALAHGRGVVISRGQLVEIGGGFRIPQIMAQSGAHLIEVGTTNRTRAADYAAAIDENTAMLLRVHSSNFRLVGFVEEAPMSALAQVAHERDVLLVDDLGSGALLDTADYGLAHEPTVAESMAAGADLILFSGDKLLGGPQAGIMIGKRDIIAQLKQHPLARAMRADKLCYAALSATLDHYRRGEAVEKIPVWRMMAMTVDQLQARVLHWKWQLQQGDVVAGASMVGGGSLPGTTLPSALLALDGTQSATTLARKLRANDPPVIGRIADDRLLLDPRTVLPEDDDALLTAVAAALA